MRATGIARLAALIWLLSTGFQPCLSAQESEAPPTTSVPDKIASGSSSDDLQQLKKRIDRLEKQNEQLQKAIQKTAAPAPVPVADPDSVSTPATLPAPVPLPLFLAPEPDLQPTPPAGAPDFSPESPTQSPSVSSAALDQTADAGWQMNWRNGLLFATRNGDFTLHVGGRMFFDGGWNAADQSVQSTLNQRLEDGALLRSARIRVDGTMYQNVSWVVEYDIANTVINDDGAEANRGIFLGTAKIAQAGATISAIPILGDVAAGYLLEPLCFSTEIQFMEQAPVLQSLIVRAPGITVSNINKAQTFLWSTGFFHDTENSFGFGFSGIGRYDEALRLIWLPWVANDGSQLLHLSAGAVRRGLINDMITLRGRPTVRTQPAVLSPSLAYTGRLIAADEDVFNLELAAVVGPWTFQAQYYPVLLEDALLNTPDETRGLLFYQGGYAEVLYFLTGEWQPYNRKRGAFERVVPRANFRTPGGWGAWQVGLRYSYLNLRSGNEPGAVLNDLTLGLNWYLNPNARVQWNFEVDYRGNVLAGPQNTIGGNGFVYIFGGRFAVDF